MSEPTADIRPVSEQIAQMARLSPSAVALSEGGRELSFEELDQRANQFAAYLVQLGIGPGGTVGVCLERSFAWIVAALGILRAGAAYVPLDLAWPDARLHFALQNSGATVLVARSALLQRLKLEGTGIDPCTNAAAIAAARSALPASIPLESLAYVIYTSGSSGLPKGVEITHRNLAHLIAWHHACFGVTGQDRASHLAGLGFDAAVWEVWPHLSAGAAVCLIDEAARTSPHLIQQWMLRERVTIGFVPTIHAGPMMGLEWPATTSLRFLLTGGDKLKHGAAAALPFSVVNNYGPTECTVVTTSGVLQAGSQQTPPIGSPIAGARVYLLDANREPVRDGETGEIYVGGDGVGRGYRNLRESTERSFLPDPFRGFPGARMYRTGDRGVRLADGQIEFRGRLDRQTKVRGQRVELDEIGFHLNQHPQLHFAAAVMHAPEEGEQQLAAYVVPRDNVPLPTSHELQQHLLRNLPDYMIPSVFVRLHAVPLSANGKIDLSKLPQPSHENRLTGRVAKGPSSAIEEQLLTLMRGLLENDAFTVADNFFLAGGHSLLGMLLVTRLRSAFGVDLTFRQLFEAPTIQRLALLVESKLLETIDAMSEEQAKTLLQQMSGASIEASAAPKAFSELS